jgi:DNA-binding transcriptional ArsR family regulator
VTPKALRAIAHPARLVVINALYDAGRELTATEAAQLAGMSPSAMSYHLRALEKFGIIKRSESERDGRERPWVRAAKGFVVRPDLRANSPASIAATSSIIASTLEMAAENVTKSFERMKSPDTAVSLDGATSLRIFSLTVTLPRGESAPRRPSRDHWSLRARRS